MEKEFIPYEQALALKELGFDGTNCMRFYNAELSLENTFLYSGNVGAPLYQQAFRWFREKYGLFVAPNAISYENGPYLWFFEVNSTILSFGIDLGETDDFENYEEAELACLNKLIEIVKNK